MQILIDTNVVLDVLLNRTPYSANAEQILRISDSDVQKFISASSVTDIFYIARKELKDKTLAINLIKLLLKIIHVANVSEQEIILALNSNWSDFEDSVQNSVAQSHNFDMIITRNKKDFSKSNIQIETPSEFMQNWNK